MSSQVTGSSNYGLGRHWAYSIPLTLICFLIILFIYIFLAVLGLLCCVSFSLVVERQVLGFVAALRLLIAVASLATEHRL